MTPSQTVLITGASSGIGYELAKLFARDGDRLVLVSRDASRLTRIAEELSRQGATVMALTSDLSVPTAADALMAALRQRGETVDVLVNNAGVGMHGFFAETDLARQLAMIHLNVTTLTHLTRLCLPSMVQHRCGKVLNVASTAAFQPGPLMAV